MRIYLFAISIFFMTAAVPHAFGFGSAESGTSSGGMADQPGAAQILAMGGAGTAAAIGSQALDWNPAGLAEYPWGNAEVAYRRHWANTEVGFVRAAWPFSWGVPAFRFAYTVNPAISAYDEMGVQTGTFSTADMALKLGFGKTWGHLAWGAACEYFRQECGGVVNGLSLDAGGRWEFLPDWHVGASLLRLGQSQAHDPAQLELRAGVSTTMIRDWLLTVDAAAPRDSDRYVAAGAEWKPYPFLALRAGIHNGPASIYHIDPWAVLTAGLGITYENFVFDYAFEPGQILGTIHHVSLGYHFQPLPARPVVKSVSNTPTAFAPVPRLEIQARKFEGRLTFVPKSVQPYQAREVRFVVRNEQGQVVKSYAFFGKNTPRELTWDGTDNQGRIVQQGKFTYSFEYVTDQGIKTEIQTWPEALPTWKLRFVKGGEGVEPSVVIRFANNLAVVSEWQIEIMQRGHDKPVRRYSGQGALAATLVWDGRDAQGRWAAPDKYYGMRVKLAAKDGSRTTIERPITPIPAVMLPPEPGVTKFKILEILFAFRSSEITSEMGDRIAKAVEIHMRQGKTISVRVEGNADEVGTEEANNKIGALRAGQVQEMMMRLGSPAMPEIISFGKRQPLSGTSQAFNRRVEIMFTIPAVAPDHPAKK